MTEISQINGLFVTECVSFPRSGHHLLHDTLTYYFGERLVYCEMYRQPESDRIGGESKTNYQKNHDFDLLTEIRSDRKYIVQVRDPLEAFASRWEMNIRVGKLNDTEQEFISTMHEWTTYYCGFIKKWVLSPVPNRLIVHYRDLIEHSEDVVSHVIQFIQGFPNTDNERIRSAIYRRNTRRRYKPLPYLHFA